MYGFMFLFNFVTYLFLLLCYKFLLLCIFIIMLCYYNCYVFRSVYSDSLCCSVYLCVNVYCTNYYHRVATEL
jgi:hypothetical protein